MVLTSLLEAGHLSSQPFDVHPHLHLLRSVVQHSAKINLVGILKGVANSVGC